MAFVLSNARKQLITMMKADLNYRLMIISSRMQRTAAEQQSITEEKASITKTQMNNLIAEKGTENLTLADINNIGFLTTDLDVQLTRLAAKDDDMECEMKSIESQLQALNAEEDEIDKLNDKNIKSEFGIFAN